MQKNKKKTTSGSYEREKRELEFVKLWKMMNLFINESKRGIYTGKINLYPII